VVSKATEKRLKSEEDWINTKDDVVDYIEISEEFNISVDSSRRDVINLVRRGKVANKILYENGGKNFFGEMIVRVHRKNPKFPGIQCERIC